MLKWFTVVKKLIRGYISENLSWLVRAVIGLRMDKDWTVSDVLEEAITDWLAKPENREIIVKHRLEE